MIFKSIDQLKDYIGGMQRNLQWESWKPFVREAEQFFIKKAIGYTFLKTLHGKVNIETLELNNANEKETELIELIRIATAAYVDYLSTYRMILSTGDSGKNIKTPTGTTAPTRWSATGSMQSSLSRGDMAMEDVLVFLEENDEDFSDWKSSDFYTKFKSGYVRTAARLTESFPFAKNSRRLFLNMKSDIEKAQGSFLNSTIGADFNNEFKERLLVNQALNAAESELLRLIGNVVSLKGVLDTLPYLNINEEWRLVSQHDGLGSENTLPDRRRDEIAVQLKTSLEYANSELINYLQANSSTVVFPTYFNSNLYTTRAERSNASGFKNDRNQKFAII